MMEIKKIRKGSTLHELELAIKASGSVDLPVTHHFSEGVYTRELFIPKGTLLIGKRHRKETVNMVLMGSISIFVDEKGDLVCDGDRPVVKRISAPAIFVSPPFSKKMGYAHEDTVFVNVHPTEETDLAEIERQVIIEEKEYKEMMITTPLGGEICHGQQ